MEEPYQLGVTDPLRGDRVYDQVLLSWGMLELARTEIDDTAKQLAATLKAEAATLDTDEKKAKMIAAALALIPGITEKEQWNAAGLLLKYGVSQEVVELARFKLPPIPGGGGWPTWLKIAATIAVVAAVGGTTYMIWRRK